MKYMNHLKKVDDFTRIQGTKGSRVRVRTGKNKQIDIALRATLI